MGLHCFGNPTRGYYFLLSPCSGETQCKRSALQIQLPFILRCYHFPHSGGSHPLYVYHSCEGLHLAFLLLWNSEQKTWWGQARGWSSGLLYAPLSKSFATYLNNHTWYLGTIEVYCLLDSIGQGSGVAELVAMAQHFFWVCSQEVSRLQLSEGLTRAGESAPSVAHSHGCWQENTVLPLMGFSTGPLKCAHDLWLSPQWVI